MARHEINHIVRRNNGLAIGGAVVYVYFAGGSTQAPVYATSTGGTPLTQPLTTNANGRLVGPNLEDRIYCDPGSLDLNQTKGTFQRTDPYEAVSAQDLGGRILAYAQRLSDVNMTATSADVPDMDAGTIVIPPSGLITIFVSAHLSNSTASGNAIIYVLEDGATPALFSLSYTNNPANTRIPASRAVTISRTPGASHAYKCQCQHASGAGKIVASALGNTPGPAELRIVGG